MAQRARRRASRSMPDIHAVIMLVRCTMDEEPAGQANPARSGVQASERGPAAKGVAARRGIMSFLGLAAVWFFGWLAGIGPKDVIEFFEKRSEGAAAASSGTAPRSCVTGTLSWPSKNVRPPCASASLRSRRLFPPRMRDSTDRWTR